MRLLLSSTLALFVSVASLNAQTVRFHTNLGDIDVNLTPAITPLTVANFLSYLDKGAYSNSIFHRSVKSFVVQGGGYRLNGNVPAAIPQDAPVTNEFKTSNTRGTIAMAKLGSDPNSATNQWFFSTVNNAANLDGQNGGFTVFGNVANAAGLAVMDKIAAVPVYDGGSPFDQIPLMNYKGGTAVAANFVVVSSIERLAVGVASTVTSAASYQPSASAGVAPGEMLAIFGAGIGAAQTTGLTLDGNGLVATTLAGTQVLFDGTPAPVIFSSANQINVLAPFNLAGKSTVTATIQYQGNTVSTVQLSVVAANPGILTADGSGKGDAAIVHPDGSPVNAARPARVGDTLLLYGEGAGVASPALADGAIVGGTLPLPVVTPQLLIDGQPVAILYAGGAPQLVNGVLQVNFTVPQLSPGSHSLQLQTGSVKSAAGVNLQTQ